ncbi:MAG: type II secretion system protein [Candidatus Dojkabacteria bacterium]|jgi:type II secretory pathway pseudopilin PulG|nr:type II secretion system protein [Candidatus Dojkabacteria bacterium]
MNTARKFISKKLFRSTDGITLIEIVIVIGLLAILAGVSIPIYRTSFTKGDLDTSASQVLSTIRLAQSKAMGGEDASKFGIHFDTTTTPDQYILFKGDTYNPSDTYNQVNNLSRQIEISSVGLGGGGVDLVFEKYSGETVNDGTITFKNTTGEFIYITINSIGKTDVSN